MQQAHEQYLTSRYRAGLSQLKSALNLSHIPVDIPPHILVTKAVALLKFQSNELQKVESKYIKKAPWDHPKYSHFKNSHSPNTHNFKQRNQTGTIATTYYHDTRHFYKSKISNKIAADYDNASKFCPSIEEETTDTDLVPPLHFDDDTDCNTMELDQCLQQQTADKLGIKCEPQSMDTTNDFSSELETSAFSMLDDEDIEFDIPLDFHSNFM